MRAALSSTGSSPAHLARLEMDYPHQPSVGGALDGFTAGAARLDRRNTRCAQRSLDGLAIPDDDDRELPRINVAPRHALHIGLRDRTHP